MKSSCVIKILGFGQSLSESDDGDDDEDCCQRNYRISFIKNIYFSIVTNVTFIKYKSNIAFGFINK